MAGPMQRRNQDNRKIEIQNVTKIYRGDDMEDDVKALTDINFHISDGEFTSIIGPSGCGKSTLLRLISGLDGPTQGTVRVKDREVNGTDSDVGFMFQTPVLLDWRTVFGNVMLPYEALASSNNIVNRKSHYEERARELLKLVNLDDFENSYPDELSGGMQQRVAIARTLLPDPEILLMDEPFGALDELTRHDMNKELLNIYNKTGKTIVFVTHNIQEAVYLSDRVVVLSDRPGQVKDIVKVDLDRPRPLEIQETDEFQTYSAKLRRLIGVTN